jgi:hypothetical protein
MQLYTNFWAIRYVKNLRIQINIPREQKHWTIKNSILIDPIRITQKPSLEYGKRSVSILIKATAPSIHILFGSLFTNHVFTFFLFKDALALMNWRRCGRLCRGQLWGSIPAFAWTDWRKPV